MSKVAHVIRMTKASFSMTPKVVHSTRDGHDGVVLDLTELDFEDHICTIKEIIAICGQSRPQLALVVNTKLCRLLMFHIWLQLNLSSS